MIEDAKFQYFECPAYVFCESIMTQNINGVTLLEAKRIEENDLGDTLNLSPDEKCQCKKIDAILPALNHI